MTFSATYGAPAPALEGLVLSYWEVAGSLGHRREKVLPRTEIVLCINLGDDQALIDDCGVRRFSSGWIAGLQQSPLVTEATGFNWLCGARFSAFGALRLFGGAAAAVAGAVVPLDDLFPRWGRAFADAVRREATPKARFAAMDRALAAFLAPATDRQATVHFIAHALAEKRIGDLVSETGWTRQRIHERFVAAFGVAPKEFQSLLRFERAMMALHRPFAAISSVAQDCGYFDQAHFSKQFRRFAGETPRDYLKSRLAVADYGFAVAS